MRMGVSSQRRSLDVLFLGKGKEEIECSFAGGEM
jgi:hypothetical protein